MVYSIDSFAVFTLMKCTCASCVKSVSVCTLILAIVEPKTVQCECVSVRMCACPMCVCVQLCRNVRSVYGFSAQRVYVGQMYCYSHVFQSLRSRVFGERPFRAFSAIFDTFCLRFFFSAALWLNNDRISLSHLLLSDIGQDCLNKKA